VHKSGFKILKELKRNITSTFGVELSNQDTKLILEKYVKIVEPVFEGDTLHGTSKKIPVMLIEHEVTDTYIGSSLTSSHRWNYLFSKTWKFLGYSMLPNGRMIRPTIDVLNRIYNPENQVKTWDDHIILLKMALLENYDNLHTQNRIYHYLMDAWWNLKHVGIQGQIVDRKLSIAHGRAAYRHCSEWVNLPASPALYDYNQYWLDLCERIMKVRLAPYDQTEYYRRTKRGRLGHSILEYSQRKNFYNTIMPFYATLGLSEPDKVKMMHMGHLTLRDEDDKMDMMLLLRSRTQYYNFKNNGGFTKKIEKLRKKTQALHSRLFAPVRKKISNLDILAISSPFSF
jgi:hypothetical protein